MHFPPLPHPGHHWVFPHHAIKFDATTTLKVLNIFEQCEGKLINSNNSPARIQINRDLGLLLSEDMRDGKQSDPFRDYQQLYTHIGVLYPHKIVNGELHLTQLAKLLLEERIGLSAFLFLQALGYQYPNGASRASVTQTFLRHNILVKPILLIYQVLVALQEQGEQQAYISQDEITTFLEPQRDHSGLESVVSSILQLRKPQFGNPPSLPHHYATDTDRTIDERERAVKELVGILEFLPFFQVLPDESKPKREGKHKIRFHIPENESIGLPELQALAAIEARPNTFYKFTDGERADRLNWYRYYGGLGRWARWNREVRAQINPPELNLKELSPSMQLPPLSVAPATVQRTPEQTAELKQQRLNAHEQVVHELASHIRQANGTTSYDPHSVDLDAHIQATRFFFEIKSLAEDQSDTVEQVREAVGQLLEYQYRAGADAPATQHLCVVFDRYPEDESWVIQYLTNHLHLGVCWWNSDTQQFEFPSQCSSDFSFLAA